MSINVYTLEPCKARSNLKSLHRRATALTFEAKLDGGRYLLGNIHDDCEPTLTGRRTSVKTREKLNKISHFPALQEMMLGITKGWLVDGEIMHPKGFRQVISIMNSLPERAFEEQVTHGNLEYYVFDVLHAPHAGDLRNEPLYKRREYLQMFMKQLYDTWPDADKYIAHIPVLGTVELITEKLEGVFDKDPLEFLEHFISHQFDKAVALGHEGLIVKNLHGAYNQTEWAKIKASESWDFVIVGYDDSEAVTYEGFGIAALQLGLYKDGVCYPVCKCSGMTDKMREYFYNNKLENMYKVVEIGGQLMQPDTLAIRHPRFIRIRDDVDATEQTFEKYGVKK